MKLIKLVGLFSLISALLAWTNPAFGQCSSITSQPVNQNVCTGVSATFTFGVTAVPNNNFQWQQWDPANPGWTNISGPPYTGFNSATLTVVGSPAGFDGFQYRCLVTKTSCSALTSNPATLVLKFAPEQVVPPVDSVICLGKNVAFEVGAIGDGLTYQWFEKQGSSWVTLSNNPPFSGVTTNKLIITNPPGTMTGSEFFAQITGACPPSTQSDTIMLTINTLPKVSTQPTDVSTCLNKQVTFAAAAQGTNVSYQWQEDAGSGFIDLPGALPYQGVYSNQLDILPIGVTAALNGRRYRCVVSGACSPADTTTPATLTVLSPANVSSMTDISTVCEGENVEVTTVASGAGLKYFWEVDKNDGAGFITLADGGVYSGTATATMKITSAPAAFDGFVYRCRVTGTCPPAPTVPIDTLRVIQDKTVGNHPADTAVTLGMDGEFRVAVIGANLSFNWQEDNGQGYQSISPTSPYYSGATAQLLKVLKPGIEKSGYKYRCLVYGGCDEVPAASNGGMLTVLWPASVGGVDKKAGVRLYPNPVSGSSLNIRVANSRAGDIEVRIVDQFGRTLMDEGATLVNGETTVSVNSLPAGVYSMFITDEQFSIVENIKFTKL